MTQAGHDPRGESQRRHRTGTGLYAHVVETLGQEIADGRMEVGQIVYAEQLSERFGISRSVVRESVRTLSSMGLLESRPQVGTRVLPMSNWDILNPQIIKWRGLGPGAADQQRELLELRLGVEPIAARFAATRMSDESAAELLKSAVGMREALRANDSFAFFDADASFHRLLLEGAENLVMAQFAETISAVLHVRNYLPSTTLEVGSVQLHLELAQALVDRNPSLAQDLATQIVSQTLQEINQNA